MIVIVGILVFVGILVYIGYTEHQQDTKKMESGEDKKKLQEIVKKVVPESENCTIAYATYTEQKGNGYAKGYTMYYWYYAVAFTVDRIHLVPLKFVDKEVYYEGYYTIEKSMVAQVWNSWEQNAVAAGRTRLYDSAGEVIGHLDLDSVMRDKLCVKQEEESAAFRAVMSQWSQEINGNG